MRDIKEGIKKDYSKVDISEKDSTVIFNNIITKHNKRVKTKKTLFSILIIFMVMTFGFGITHAEEIKNNITVFISKISNRNNHTLKLESTIRKELNFNATLNEPNCISKMDRIYGVRDSKCYSTYTSNDLNKLLNIKLLNSNSSKEKEYTLYKVIRDENNNIKHLDFRISNMFNILPEKNQNFNGQEGLIVSLRAIILTKFINEDTYWDYSIDKSSNIEEYYIKALETKAYITDYSEDKSELLGKTRKIVLLAYDDIVYRIDITSLYDENETNNKIYEFLESLTY